MPKRKAVTCTGHCAGLERRRTSTIGSGWGSSKRQKAAKTTTDSAMVDQPRSEPAPSSRSQTRPPISTPSATVTSAEAGPVDAAGVVAGRLLDADEDDEEDGGHDDGGHREQDVHVERLDEQRRWSPRR